MACGRQEACCMSFLFFHLTGREDRNKGLWKGAYLRIDSATIGMESARSYQQTKAVYRRFSIMEYREGSLTFTGEGLKDAAADGESLEDTTQTEDQNKTEGMATLEDLQKQMGIASSRLQLRGAGSGVQETIRQVTLRYIFSLLFADRRDRLNQWLEDNSFTQTSDVRQTSGQSQMLQSVGTNIRILNYTAETINYEMENTGFSTVGTVRTADGREINFNIDVAMSRSFQQTFREDLQIASVSMCDPLVINLDTDVAELSDQKFYFDLDADGELDEISSLGAGSGYLALDKNGDGVINDGSELFGTSNGDGFADLAKYDEDGNGWIDEGDAIWSKLKIWCKDENGNDVLYSLKEKGVGAICLQKAATDFTLQGENGINGAIRSTGVFLYENGMAGTLQHVDLATGVVDRTT